MIERSGITIFDWLACLSKAVKIVFPNSKLQRCVVYKIRNTKQLVKSTDEKEILSDLKKKYTMHQVKLKQ